MSKEDFEGLQKVLDILKSEPVEVKSTGTLCRALEMTDDSLILEKLSPSPAFRVEVIREPDGHFRVDYDSVVWGINDPDRELTPDDIDDETLQYAFTELLKKNKK